MPSPQPVPTQNQYLNSNLIPVALSSAASPCPICKEPYSSSSPPILLPECGHIFCQPCITAWFNSGLENANTCPLDRRVLFPCLPEAGVSDMYGGSALARRPPSPARSTVTRPVVELFMNGQIIAINGRLTHRGCKCVVRNLWHLTARLLHSLEEFCGTEVDALGLDIELLRSCVQDALPRGVRCAEGAWVVLYGCARQMLVWHGEWGRDVWENGQEVPVEELRGFVVSLYEACGG
ncbi:hypothetical protein M3J09_000132 [Ascochyta lentis]